MALIDPQHERYDAAVRAREKSESRADDDAALVSGAKSPEQLRVENGAFGFPRSIVRIDYSGRKY